MGKKLDRKPKIDEEFRDLDRGWVAAYMHGDPELFSRIWADGFIFTFPFAQFSNKEQALADIKSGNLAFESLSTEDMSVKFYGKTAVMAGRFMMKGQYRGHDISGAYNYTNVLEKLQEHSWQIVASHAAPVA